MLKLGSVLFAVVVALAVAMPTQAAKRVALVIGNSAYTNAPALPNPRNDAEDIAAALTELGFDVIPGLDLDREGMEDAIDRFGAAAEGADVALVFYAGHGIQVAGENYALPIDAKLRNERDLRRAMPLTWLVQEAGRAGRLGLVILDACRNNPLAEEMKRGLGATRAFAVGRGLARLEDAPTNTLIAYATSADATADDGSGRNSPYTAALLAHLGTPGLEVRQLFGRVRDTVMGETNGVQTPFTYGSLGGDAIYLGPEPSLATTPPAPQPAPQPVPVPVQPPRVDESLIEIEFWTSIKDSDEPAFFEAYLVRFPDGTFVTLAQIRLQKLQEAALTPEPTPTPTPTPAPQPPGIQVDEMSQPYWVVTASNVRAGPSTDYNRVGGFDAGAQIMVTGKVRGENWYRVAIAGGVGYIYGGLIQQSPPTSATASPAPSNPPAGTPHDTYPNVVWNSDGDLVPAPGYEWASDDLDDLSVVWGGGEQTGNPPAGTYHDTYPNVVWTADGELEPAPGYDWASDDPDSFDVVWSGGGQTGNPPAGTYHDTFPNVVWNAEGNLDPASGYRWANDDPNSFDVVRVNAGTPHDTHPNVVWDEDGQLQPAPGYQWYSDDPDSYDVMRVYAGTPHYKYPNVVWDGAGQLEPAPGYSWVTNDANDYRVQLD